MENMRFKITLSDESKYYDLERYLKDAGYFVELESIPPTDEQMGGEVKALLLTLVGTVSFEQVQAGIHHFEETHRVQVHIEIIEPKKPEDDLPPRPKIIEQPPQK